MVHTPLTNLEKQKTHPLYSLGSGQSLEEKLQELRHEKPYHWAAERVNGQPVLEIGCNTGYGTEILARQAGHVFGLDVNPEAIRVARMNHSMPNIEYRLTEGTAIPALDPKPRFAVFFQLLEHIRDPLFFLTEIRSSLTEDGSIILTTPNAAMRLRKGQKPWNPFHVREFRADELRTLLNEVFGTCRIFGLFGIPEVHEMERARVRQTWVKVRISDPIKRWIRWDWLEPRLRRLLGISQPHPSPFQAKDLQGPLSLDCYYLSPDHLDDALDLYAIAPAPQREESR
jgi:SAM-dependent methyltransferase